MMTNDDLECERIRGVAGNIMKEIISASVKVPAVIELT